MKYFSDVAFSCIFLSTIIPILGQQLKNPDEFLGYPLGEQYTPHHRIVSYFQQAAAAKPQMMKLEQYGQTSEGRPLLLAFIASEENLAKLEDIRKNNLRLAGILTDQPGNLNTPAIVWLSYNVHGNETSSSEAIHENIVRIIEPCQYPN